MSSWVKSNVVAVVAQILVMLIIVGTLSSKMGKIEAGQTYGNQTDCLLREAIYKNTDELKLNREEMSKIRLEIIRGRKQGG